MKHKSTKSRVQFIAPKNDKTLAGKTSSVTLNLFQGLLPSRYDDNRETSPTGQTNIDRSRIKFGMTQSGTRLTFRHSELVSESKNNHRKAAFTLAEVLITFGIIGVVAAMTMPTLIQTYKKHVVETRLQKVYSVMNQAITSSTVENGETNTWEGLGNYSATYEDTLTWFNKYLGPYLKYTEVKQENGTENLLVYFPDGTALGIRRYISGMLYYLEPKCLNNNTCKNGTNTFSFALCPKLAGTELEQSKRPTVSSPYKYYINPGFEPYAFSWDGTVDGAKYSTINNGYGCYEDSLSALCLCTKLIQLNHWKIPDDYPYKF